MPIRLHITAEGQTEERFVKEVLSPYLGERNVWTDARCVLTSKNNRLGVEYRGGWRRSSAYTTVKRDICTWMKEDRNPDVRFTTMFHLYALPRDFPGYDEAYRESNPYRRSRQSSQRIIFTDNWEGPIIYKLPKHLLFKKSF